MKWNYDKIRNFTSKVGSGATPKGGEASYKTSGIPLIRSQNVHFGGLRMEGLVYLDDQQASKLDNVRVELDDVLLNITGASIGRVCLAPLEMEGARVNQHVCIIRPEPGTVLPGFLELFLGAPEIQDFILETESGATREALTKGKVLEFEVPTPSLEQQAWIVSTTTSQLERVSRAEKSLEAAIPLLERFRQSVLASAFRGDLTAEWREQNPDVEPASELLERLRVERKRLWIEDYARKLADRARASAQKKNKVFTHEDWQTYYDKKLKAGASKYEEPELNEEELEASQQEAYERCAWGISTLEALVDPQRGIPYGIVQTGTHMEGGIPTVRCGDIKGFSISLDELKQVDPEIAQKYERTELLGEEVLIAIRGTVGATAVASPSMAGMNISREVAMIPSLPMLLPKYIMYALASPQCQQAIHRKVKGVAQQGINLGDLKSIVVPIASVAEQAQIVERIEKHLAVLDRLHHSVNSSQADLDRLRASILAQAFSSDVPEADES